MQADAWGNVTEALTQLRLAHGRLPELDAIETAVAAMASELRQLRMRVDTARGALTPPAQSFDQCVVGPEEYIPSILR